MHVFIEGEDFHCILLGAMWPFASDDTIRDNTEASQLILAYGFLL